MTASMYQGEGGYTQVVGHTAKGTIPKPVAALKQGSAGAAMSDLQFMQESERKQHEQAYIYEHGHNDGSAPLGQGSF